MSDATIDAEVALAAHMVTLYGGDEDMARDVMGMTVAEWGPKADAIRARVEWMQATQA